jgi:hypothetical protein
MPAPPPLYSSAELQAAAVDLGCYPWDVAGIYTMLGVSLMTLEQFEDGLAIWRTLASLGNPEASQTALG